MRRFKVIIFVFTISVCLVASCVYSQQRLEISPLNPQFTKHLSEKSEKTPAYGLGKFPLGAFPSPLDLSHLKKEKSAGKILSLPASYDLRNYGKVTEVKDQQNCGACWAFGSIASIESYLLPQETRDFSENNLKNKHGFDYTCCYGGNVDMATAYFARWNGPVNENDDSYNSSCSSPSSLTTQKHIQNVIYIPGRRSANDNDYIKKCIMNFGAVTTSMYWDDNSYNPATSSYYYDGGTDTNHLVAIIGWDDNFSSSKFAYAPQGNGAFLVKNSWGKSFGSSGYFWVSYYDSSFAYWHSGFFSADSTSNFENIYQYDTLGMTSSVGYSSSTAWAANIFTALSDTTIAAVGSYFLAENSPIEVYIYTQCAANSPVSGTLAFSGAGNISYAGYMTASLDPPVSIGAGQTFSIVCKMTTYGYNYPIPIETPIDGYSSGAQALSGQSFCSSNGTSWDDLNSYFPGSNVCIKAFTKAGAPPPPVDPPVINSMQKLGSPFRIAVNGGNLKNNLKVYIDGYEWTTIKWKSESQIILKGGSSLKALVPKNTWTTFLFVNPDGGETTFEWKWP
jgi:C1A family cysteine protease